MEPEAVGAQTVPDDLVIPPRPPLPATAGAGDPSPADTAPSDAAVPEGAVTDAVLPETEAPDAAPSSAAPSDAAATDAEAVDAAASEPAAAEGDRALDTPEGEASESPAEGVQTGGTEDPTPPDAAVEEPLAAEAIDQSDAVRVESGDDDDETSLAVDSIAEVSPLPEAEQSSDAVQPEAPAVGETRSDESEVPESAPDDAASVEDPTPPEVAVEEPPVETEHTPDEVADDAVAQEEAEPAPGDPVVHEDESEAREPEPTAASSAGAAIGAASVEANAAADEAVPALTLRNVTKTFGELRAVDGIDLTIPAGSFYGLVGPNGAGKTTTLSIIAGLLRADGGTVSINGVDAARQSRVAKKMIGVLPDRLRTFDRLTGRQLLSYYGALRGLPAALVESRAADLARAFDLVDALARPVSDYSAGMTKKVMLAGAMIHSPRLLVLDEPFEAVDPVSSAVILDILGAYVAHGGTVILSSHGMELVERVCSRVAVIVSGQVLAEGTVDEVRGEASLEQRFLELAGGLGDVEGLEWLHTFSG